MVRGLKHSHHCRCLFSSSSTPLLLYVRHCSLTSRIVAALSPSHSPPPASSKQQSEQRGTAWLSKNSATQSIYFCSRSIYSLLTLAVISVLSLSLAFRSLLILFSLCFRSRRGNPNSSDVSSERTDATHQTTTEYTISPLYLLSLPLSLSALVF